MSRYSETDILTNGLSTFLINKLAVPFNKFSLDNFVKTDKLFALDKITVVLNVDLPRLSCCVSPSPLRHVKSGETKLEASRRIFAAKKIKIL